MKKEDEFPGDEFVFFASDFRDWGAVIDDEIPDCAWVPRTSVTFGKEEAESGDDGTIRIKSKVEISEPFRWVTTSVIKLSDIDDKKEA